MWRNLTVVLAAAFVLVGLPACGSSKPEPVLVEVTTDLGRFVVDVYVAAAPESSKSFLEFVDGNLYEGATFYRTVTRDNDNGSPVIEVIQGGLADDAETPAPVRHETTEQTGILHKDGVISLARAEPGTGSGAAFFICIGDQPGLDFGAPRNPDMQGFAAFGKVIEGMDVVRAIHAREANAPTDSPYLAGQILTEPVVIQSARRVSDDHS